MSLRKVDPAVLGYADPLLGKEVSGALFPSSSELDWRAVRMVGLGL